MISAPQSLAQTKNETLIEIFRAARVIPVVTIERVEDAVPLARALIAGGVHVLEITLRTAAAENSAKSIAANVPEALIGVGTILTPNDLARAQSIGAHFALSPGTTPELFRAAAASNLPFVPGIATSSELMVALAYGFELFKFFPAQQSGGIATLRALAGPFPLARFCPTGGIGEANAAEWLAEPNVAAVGGSWLCSAADIKAGNWSKITNLARHAADVSKATAPAPPAGEAKRECEDEECSAAGAHYRNDL